MVPTSCLPESPSSQATLCDVLIVEDDPLQGGEIADYLIRARYTVQTLNCGSEAIHRVADMKPRIALLDYNLPDMNGICVAERIRNLAPQTTVILMSGRIDDLPEAILREAGLYAFLAKPISLAALRRTVEKTLRTTSETGSPLIEPAKRFSFNFLGGKSPKAAIIPM